MQLLSHCNIDWAQNAPAPLLQNLQPTLRMMHPKLRIINFLVRLPRN